MVFDGLYSCSNFHLLVEIIWGIFACMAINMDHHGELKHMAFPILAGKSVSTWLLSRVFRLSLRVMAVAQSVRSFFLSCCGEWWENGKLGGYKFLLVRQTKVVVFSDPEEMVEYWVYELGYGFSWSRIKAILLRLLWVVKSTVRIKSLHPSGPLNCRCQVHLWTPELGGPVYSLFRPLSCPSQIVPEFQTHVESIFPLITWQVVSVRTPSDPGFYIGVNFS